MKVLPSSDYPYLYARVSSRKAKLLSRSDYEKLAKMEINSIARNLEEGEYSQEIKELGDSYEGEELMEYALSRNLSRTLNEILDMATGDLETVLRVYIRRYDILSLKRILRWKRSDRDRDVESLIIPGSSLNPDEITTLMGMEYDEIVETIEFKDSLVDYSKRISERGDLDIETALDIAHADEMREVARRIDSAQFTRYVESELEHKDAITALRLLNSGVEKEEILTKTSDSTEMVNELAEASSMEKAQEILEKKYGVEADSLQDLERKIEIKRLRDALRMSHAEPLKATSILGYVVAKRVEVKNLRTIVRAVEADMTHEEIMEQVIVE